MRLRAPEGSKSATPIVLGVALVIWALHACSALALAIASRGCSDECHGFALAAVFSTTLLGSVVVICAALAAWRWWHGDRAAARSPGLFATALGVGVALLVLAFAALVRVAPDLTIFEVLAAAYAAGVGVVALAGARSLKRQDRRTPYR